MPETSAPQTLKTKKLKNLTQILKKLIPAITWNGKELVLNEQGTEVSVGTIARKSLKNTKGNYETINRITVKPNFWKQGPEVKKHASITVKDYPLNQDPIDVETDAILAVIWANILPNLREDSVYKDFRNREKFFKDFQSLLELTNQDKEKLLNILIKDNDKYVREFLIHEDKWFIYRTILLCEGNMPVFAEKTNKMSLEDLILKISNKSSSGGTMSTRNRIRDRVTEGMKRGTVGALNRKSVNMIVDALGPNAPDWTRTALFKRAAEGFTPAFILTLLSFDTSNRIPAAAKQRVEKLCDMALESFADHAAGDVMEQIIDLAGPLLEQWNQAAEQLVQDESSENELEAVLASSERQSRSIG